jgi:hypothetical protein
MKSRFEERLEQVLQRPILEDTWRDRMYALTNNQRVISLIDFASELDAIQDVMPIEKDDSILHWLYRAHRLGLLTKSEIEHYNEILVSNPLDLHL